MRKYETVGWIICIIQANWLHFVVSKTASLSSKVKAIRSLDLKHRCAETPRPETTQHSPSHLYFQSEAPSFLQTSSGFPTNIAIMSANDKPTRGVQELRPYDVLTESFARRTAANSAPYLIDFIKPTDSILDVGCGSGSITLGFAQLVPQGHVIGIDVTEKELALARGAATAQGVKNVEFRFGDAHKLLEDFEDDTFNIVHAHQVLFHIHEPVKVLRYMRQLTRPGGLVASGDSADLVFWPHNPAFDKQKEIWYKMCDMKGTVPNAGRFSHVWVREVGFEWSQIQLGSKSEHYFGEAMRNFAAGASTVGYMFREAGMTTLEECQEIEKSYKEWAAKPESRILGLDGWILCRK